MHQWRLRQLHQAAGYIVSGRCRRHLPRNTSWPPAFTARLRRRVRPPRMSADSAPSDADHLVPGMALCLLLASAGHPLRHRPVHFPIPSTCSKRLQMLSTWLRSCIRWRPCARRRSVGLHWNPLRPPAAIPAPIVNGTAPLENYCVYGVPSLPGVAAVCLKLEQNLVFWSLRRREPVMAFIDLQDVHQVSGA